MTKKIYNDGKKHTMLIISAKLDKYQNFRLVFESMHKDKKTISAVCDFYGVDKGGFFGLSKQQLCRSIYAKAQQTECEIVQPDN